MTRGGDDCVTRSTRPEERTPPSRKPRASHQRPSAASSTTSIPGRGCTPSCASHARPASRSAGCSANEDSKSAPRNVMSCVTPHSSSSTSRRTGTRDRDRLASAPARHHQAQRLQALPRRRGCRHHERHAQPDAQEPYD